MIKSKQILFSNLAISCFLFSCHNRTNTEGEKPNLLFIFPDQYRAQAIGFMSEDPVSTPNLDRFAGESRIFVNAVSNRPLSSPYRGMLMTGKYCFSSNIPFNCNTSSRKYGVYLREDETCFSDVLHSEGYTCGYIGKWHLDPPLGPDCINWQESEWDAYTPRGSRRHGFDFWHSYGCCNHHLEPHYWVNDAQVEDTMFVKQWSPIHEADVAVDFITNPGNRHNDPNKPWALFIAMNPPHPPYSEVPLEYKQLYQDIPADTLLNRANVPSGPEGDIARKSVQDYFSMVNGVDEQIGRILDALAQSGLDKNTIVVFTSDHGEMMGSHGRMEKNVWYEESFRIPFIVRWPDHISPGIDSLFLSTPDIMPTFLNLMGFKEKIPTTIEGEDYSEVFLGKNHRGPEFSIYLEPDVENTLGGRRGLRNKRYTFIVERNNMGKTVQYLLFDNLNDPYQLINVADNNPLLIRSYEEKLLKKLTEINDPWIIFNRIK